MNDTPQKKLIGIFGGSFNPPHVSHVLACHLALCAWPLSRILVIPNLKHPLQKELVDFEHRFRMARLAFKHLGDWIEVSRIEKELGGISYTIDTVRALKVQNPDAEFRIIIGSDILEETGRWKNFHELQVLAPFLVIPRLESRGAEGESEDLFLPAVSSTTVRARLEQGSDVGLAVPEAVLEYIRNHNLYVNNSGDD